MVEVQLTARQREILEVIERHMRERGYPPSVREIGEAVGLTSPSTVHNHLASAQRLGVLPRGPPDPPPPPPAPGRRPGRWAPAGAPPEAPPHGGPGTPLRGAARGRSGGPAKFR